MNIFIEYIYRVLIQISELIWPSPNCINFWPSHWQSAQSEWTERERKCIKSCPSPPQQQERERFFLPKDRMMVSYEKAVSSLER